ncbi:MAG TPA: (2Fe-2S)-binding protein, partial [Gammaproteobacteria bacterium]|nr:(2Fe-2S)-binding protein [Gammaproteobacteria bacterium]
DDAPLCSCFGVGRRRVVEAIRRGRLVSAEDVGHELKAGTSCGSCLPELAALLKQELALRTNIRATRP